MIGLPVARSCWLLVHPDGRVNWKSIDFREDRPRVWTRWTRWRWQRWTIAVDAHDDVLGQEARKP